MTNTNLIPFSFEGKSVRVIKQGDTPHWVLVDVCDVLEIRNSRDASSRLDDDEKGVGITDTLGGPQEVAIINESGLWSLVLTSRKPEAKRFKKWLTAEVIPAIRKTGGYMVATPEETPEQLALRAMQVLQATVDRQKVQIADMQEDVSALDRIAKADGSLCITEAAKALQMRPKDLFDYLSRNNWIYRRPGGKTWLGYAQRCNTGDLEHKVHTVLKADGSEKVCERVLVTAQGLRKLAKLLPSRLQAVA
ncbi:phage antirepressor KilAC domain-containing protein [Bombella saccharophila]|uniref:Phage antirepressor KilAC domain-containing protein n=1 Tax=Bombella saccharophila TaxID=2967338 RepID=A0ABT3W5W1_9PROT|nr:phage antirepressor KilAC domain-containing protein [Bombella saccharophila]MCX5614450.1 phage antirepressor KilAC domain-containing protein [Bombella saccharophila]